MKKKIALALAAFMMTGALAACGGDNKAPAASSGAASGSESATPTIDAIREKGEIVMLTNAAGGVNFDFHPGDLMLITDQITTAVPSPLIGPNIEELGTRFPDMSEVYSKNLQKIIRKSAKDCGIPLQEGVYVQLTGPNYETPAEIRMVRSWGADAVGMSTACEAMAARHMGMEVCGISCITNMAAGVSDAKLNHAEVQETADRVAKDFEKLVTDVIAAI